MDKISDEAAKRWQMAQRLGCSASTIEHFGELFDAVIRFKRPIRDKARIRGRYAAKNRDWTACDICQRYQWPASITCATCRLVNQ